MNHFETTTVIQVDNYSCSFLNQRPKQAMTEVWLYFWFIYLHQDLSPKAIRSDKLVMPEQRWSLDRRPTVKILGRRHPRFRFYFSCKWSIFFLYLWCQLFLILSAVWSIFICFWSKIDHHNFFFQKCCAVVQPLWSLNCILLRSSKWLPVLPHPLWNYLYV